MSEAVYLDLLRGVREAERRGETAIVATLLGEADRIEKCVIGESGEVLCGSLDKDILPQLRGEIAYLLRGSTRVRAVRVNDSEGQAQELFLEVLKPKVRLAVFGAGHVGQAVSLMGAFLGFRVEVFDDREELLTRERFPDRAIKPVVCNFGDVGAVLGNLRNSVVVIVTRGHQYDEDCLRAVLKSEALYIGMIGSRRRVLSIFKRLQRDGAADSELARVHAPIGLRIGAVTPQEIAVSIMAEVIQVLNGREQELPGAAD